MKNDPYFELLEIIQAQEKLELLAARLAVVAGRLAKRMSKKIVVSPSDRFYETFEATDEIIWEK